MSNGASWIVQRPVPAKELRLICFSHAGGSAVSFMDWQSAMAPPILVCAVQLPGRGARYHEPPCSNLPELVGKLAAVIDDMDDLPCAFFGHSLGALLAFEVARHQRRRGRHVPRHLFVSGCHAPRHRGPPAGLAKLSDEALIARLRGYGGTPPELLAHRELMALVLPAVRADFSLVEDYAYAPDATRFDIPMTVLAGTADTRDSAVQVEGWRQETSAACEVRWFDGDHFFINSCRREVIDCINAELTSWSIKPARAAR